MFSECDCNVNLDEKYKVNFWKNYKKNPIVIFSHLCNYVTAFLHLKFHLKENNNLA